MFQTDPDTESLVNTQTNERGSVLWFLQMRTGSHAYPKAISSEVISLLRGNKTLCVGSAELFTSATELLP